VTLPRSGTSYETAWLFQHTRINGLFNPEGCQIVAGGRSVSGDPRYGVRRTQKSMSSIKWQYQIRPRKTKTGQGRTFEDPAFRCRAAEAIPGNGSADIVEGCPSG